MKSKRGEIQSLLFIRFLFHLNDDDDDIGFPGLLLDYKPIYIHSVGSELTAQGEESASLR